MGIPTRLGKISVGGGGFPHPAPSAGCHPGCPLSTNNIKYHTHAVVAGVGWVRVCKVKKGVPFTSYLLPLTACCYAMMEAPTLHRLWAVTPPTSTNSLPTDRWGGRAGAMTAAGTLHPLPCYLRRPLATNTTQRTRTGRDCSTTRTDHHPLSPAEGCWVPVPAALD